MSRTYRADSLSTVSRTRHSARGLARTIADAQARAEYPSLMTRYTVARSSAIALHAEGEHAIARACENEARECMRRMIEAH